MVLLREEDMVSCQQARGQPRAVRKGGGFSVELLQPRHRSLQDLFPFHSRCIPYGASLPHREVGIFGGALSQRWLN